MKWLIIKGTKTEHYTLRKEMYIDVLLSTDIDYIENYITCYPRINIG